MNKTLYPLGFEYGVDNSHMVLDNLLSCAYSYCCDLLDEPEPLTAYQYYQLFGTFMGGVIAGWSKDRFPPFDGDVILNNKRAAAPSDGGSEGEA